jgi:hypothetical protein
MKYIFISIIAILAFSTQTVLAITKPIPSKEISLDVNFNSSSLNQYGKPIQNTVQGVVKLTPSKDNWVVLAELQSNDAQQKPSLFVLLGKLKSRNKNEVNISFLTIMLNSNSQLALEKNITTIIDKKNHIELNHDKNNIQIDVTAHIIKNPTNN